jgi:cell division transport system permease protein
MAGILTVAVSLSLAGAALLLNQGVNRAVGRWRGGVELIVFLSPKATPAQTGAVGAQLKADPQVKSYRFVDQAQSFQEFKSQYASQPDLLQAVTAKDLPPSYRVVLTRPNQAAAVGARFRHQPGIYRVMYNRQAVNSMLRVTTLVQAVIVVLAVVLLLSALVLIVNASRMAIFARRREVAVMKLVGATNWFIRVPFMLEGLVQGVTGALVAVAALFGLSDLVGYLIRHFHVTVFHAALLTLPQVLAVQGLLVLLGAVVGVGSSALGIRRFLEV